MHWWDPQLKEYQALPVWKDFPALWEGVIAKAGAKAEDYPFWLLTARSMQYAWGANMGIQLMKEVADNVTGHRGVIVNTATAARLGIGDGDPIEISTPKRTIRGRAVVRQGIRPDTLLAIGQFDHWKTPLAKDFGVASLNSLATMSIELTDATGSGADIVRVKLARADGGEK
jgi:phenylacetyl-CoA:acceptor oxidoreductase